MDIFLIDLEIIETNEMLQKLLSEITYLASNKPYILALEDFDRCKIFKNNFYDGKFNISIASLLSLFDGVVETHGRILFLTVNNLSILNNIDMNVLIRPGRIDKIIKFDYCDEIQIKKIIQCFYDLSDEEKNNLIIPEKFLKNQSPANIIKFLQLYKSKEDIEQLFLEYIPINIVNETTDESINIKNHSKKRTRKNKPRKVNVIKKMKLS